MANSVAQHFSYWRQNWRQRDPQTSSSWRWLQLKLCHLISREADFCGLWTSDRHLIQRISPSVELLFFPESLHIFWWNYSKSIVATYKERISKNRVIVKIITDLLVWPNEAVSITQDPLCFLSARPWWQSGDMGWDWQRPVCKTPQSIVTDGRCELYKKLVAKQKLCSVLMH